MLYRFQICSTYVYPFAYAFLPLFALHFNALSSLIRWRYAIHPHTHPHTYIHIRMEPQSNSNPNCSSSIFSNRLVSISRFLLNLPPPLAPRFPDRANWFLGRGSLHYAGTYVFKFHSCVAFFVFPFFCATLLHLPSLIYACLMCVRGGGTGRSRGEGGCQVATCRATALSFDLGFAFFTRCGPLTDERIDGGGGEGEEGKRQAQNLGLGFHFC